MKQKQFPTFLALSILGALIYAGCDQQPAEAKAPANNTHTVVVHDPAASPNVVVVPSTGSTHTETHTNTENTPPPTDTSGTASTTGSSTTTSTGN
jgi:hypothetical protein